VLREGSQAPDFEVTAHTGETLKLSELRGKKVVLYFYPKDDTPGCTIEAQELRDHHSALEKADTIVLGVSADDNASHGDFARKHQLPFLLLPDPDHTLARAYGVPVRLGFTKRVTFVIDREGKIAKTFDDVNPNGHAAEIMKVVAAL
jgi:peroxiredoxin Q/BCP